MKRLGLICDVKQKNSSFAAGRQIYLKHISCHVSFYLKQYGEVDTALMSELVGWERRL